MSYDINFWKQERSLELTNEEIYAKLCSDEAVDGLARLPTDKILQRLRERFPAFDPSDDFPDVELEDGNIEFLWSDYYFRFDLRGNVCASEKNAIVDILAQYGCPMYDPQSGTRYDAVDGTELGEKAKFEDPTPEQLAEVQRMQEELLAKIQMGGKKKAGCGTSTSILLVLVFVLIGLFWKTVC